ncbi:ABC transporter substrate-binding protein [Bradyrhizobium macuxiense]|uniref:ABC transporter substrate-binding protein n=1 Tax=Bradyrhizobium macuxiense TaxID=1755647 RepID=A0A109JGL3_9BRAD|nr:Bug family tripartite tricarboxylate transporter substrate binding protein [Bradyrhizobium macuxiense]KWV48511.1 ABC transporter substrate-binding protein [Bradyrhizobium macuxiense]
MLQRRLFIFVAAGAALAASTGLAQQGRTMRILIGFPPGGTVDAIGRVLAEKLRSSLGQTIIVENKPGASGRIMLGELKRAAPDGMTLALVQSGAMVIAPWIYANPGYDVEKDFTPIARISTFDFALTAGPSAPEGDLSAVLAWMKANPANANFATAGAGGLTHFAGLLVSQATGVPLSHVPYRGGAPAMQDLMGGQVPLMIDTLSQTLEQHRAGKLRILAVTGEQRNRALPDVPTLREQGINVVADACFGLYGPADMPADTLARIERAVAQALEQSDVQEAIYRLGLVPDYATGAQLAAIQAAQLKKWESPIKASGFKAE